jgi:hypothetical protein
MHGSDRRSGELFSYVDVEMRVRTDHPLRTIRSLVNETLEALIAEFDALYSTRTGGRRSRRRCCCGRCCCRRSTQSARSAS